MTDKTYELYGPNHIIKLENEYTLVQGHTDDKILMMRPVDQLLECERNNIQSSLMYGELDEE